MAVADKFERFMELSQVDSRLSPLHFSLYMAVLYLRQSRGGEDGIEVNARTLMPLAKIGSATSYHRVIRELNAYGYIRYEPSCDCRKPSRVWLEDEVTVKNSSRGLEQGD
jgi:hypothetical protein